MMPDDQVEDIDASCYPVDDVAQLMMLSSGCRYLVKLTSGDLSKDKEYPSY
jgi:hypothetical protein